MAFPHDTGGPYEAFAGRECARALALMAVDPKECNDELGDLDERQLKTLEDWIHKFQTKYGHAWLPPLLSLAYFSRTICNSIFLMSKCIG